MGREPGRHLVCLVGPAVVEQKANIELLLHDPVDPLRKVNELGRPMSRQAFSDHLASLDIEGCEQGRRAVAFLDVGHRGRNVHS